jgi:hypothetical protein
MDNPNIRADLHGINDTIGVPLVAKYKFHYARTASKRTRPNLMKVFLLLFLQKKKCLLVFLPSRRKIV